MASLVLTTVGGALGGALGGPIGTVLGQLGGALGARALGLDGSGSSRTAVGPRLTTLNGIASTEGAPIARLFGRARIGGQMIWATRFEEHVSQASDPSSGGKASSSSANEADVTIPTPPISRSACAKGRSPLCAASGRMGRRSTAQRSPIACIAARRIRTPIP